MKEANSKICRHGGEVAAFLDGELSPADESSFELHLAGCEICSMRLNEQKRLLCALDFAFDDKTAFELPQNFARTVAVRADSDVSGLRSREERRRAFIFASLLFLAGVLVGIAGKKTGMIDGTLAKTIAVANVFYNFFHHFSTGAIVILRTISRDFLNHSAVFVWSVITITVFSLFLLAKYYRAQNLTDSNK